MQQIGERITYIYLVDHLPKLCHSKYYLILFVRDQNLYIINIFSCQGYL